jgi:CRISPR/Cas system-associated exonuclease Cas4 (RecB family)
VGQAKFLESAARELARDLGRMVAVALKEGKTLAQGLLLAGLRLQAEAQRRTPVDTGHLRSSAFTRQETGAVQRG